MVDSMLRCLLVSLLCSAQAFGAVNTVSVSFSQDFDAPRWFYDKNAKIRGGELISLMVAAKKAQMRKERLPCINALVKAQALGKSLAPWLTYNELQCALLPDKKGRTAVETLTRGVNSIESKPRWLLSGPAATPLRQVYKQALMALIEVQVKSNRAGAWKNLDRLQSVSSWLSADEKAQMFRWAGELSFIEQNLSAAQDFISRSLSEKDSAELRTRLESIRLSIAARKKVEAPKPTPINTGGEDLGVSDEQKEIYRRMNRAIDSQDYISAVEDGVTLIEKFSGSTQAQEASDKILDIYLSIASRSEEKFRHVRERVVREMERADSGRLFRWANNAYVKGNYIDALSLAEKSFKKYNNHVDSTKALLLAARAALAAGEYSEAQNYFEKLTNEHGGTIEGAEAIFRLGLLEFRRERYNQALAYFERVAALAAAKDFAYRALYWQWRAQQKANPEKADEVAQRLIQKFPFTYYGLRAQLETGKKSIELSNQPLNLKFDMRLLENERLAWERTLVLLKAGWFKEAQSEIEDLPEATTSEERLVRGKLYAMALRYDLAINMISKGLEDNPELAQVAVLKVIYPKEYGPYVQRESKNNALDENLVRALMRQESSFRYDVRSPSSAMGVMQVIPGTANELAKELKLKDFLLPDSMYDPEINIRIGGLYLSRMIRSFGGNVPLALAAYNTGPARMKRWIAARKDLSQIEGNSSPRSEIWIDELPWEETSFYVKAILRNQMIYRLLDNSSAKFADPIWGI